MSVRMTCRHSQAVSPFSSGLNSSRRVSIILSLVSRSRVHHCSELRKCLSTEWIFIPASADVTVRGAFSAPPYTAPYFQMTLGPLRQTFIFFSYVSGYTAGFGQNWMSAVRLEPVYFE
jgi:hypothetical protein